MKTINPQIWEAPQTSNRRNKKKPYQQCNNQYYHNNQIAGKPVLKRKILKTTRKKSHIIHRRLRLEWLQIRNDTNHTIRNVWEVLYAKECF